jgi:riboflavin-specific deaminase-like protein
VIDSTRIRVAICAATSLDGKLSTATRAPVTFTSRADRARLFALRDAADAILIGAGTLRAEDPPLLPTKSRADARQAAGRRRWPVRVVVSDSLEFPLERALKDPSDEAPVVVLTSEVEDTTRANHLRDRGFDVVSYERRVHLGKALQTLADRYVVRDVLCEGGGVLNAALLGEGLVDTLYLTLCPLILGGERAPTLADGPAISLSDVRLTALEQVGQEVFLTYEVN